MNEVTNNDDVIDSRDVIARIEELCGLVMDEEMNGYLPDADPGEVEELRHLRDLHNEGRNLEDWEHGATLIRYSYFITYAQELAEDIGAINPDAGWPNNCIDWERAAFDLRMDYTAVEFDGVTYYAR